MKYFVIILFSIVFLPVFADENLFYGSSDFVNLSTVVTNEPSTFEIKIQIKSLYGIQELMPIFDINPKNAAPYVRIEAEQLGWLESNSIGRIQGTVTVDEQIPYDKIFVSVSFIGTSLGGNLYKSAWADSVIVDIEKQQSDFVYPTPSGIISHLFPVKKQFEAGLRFEELRCDEGFLLILKYDGTPACVKPDTKAKLISRGWMKTQVDVRDDSAFIEATKNLDEVQIFLSLHPNAVVKVDHEQFMVIYEQAGIKEHPSGSIIQHTKRLYVNLNYEGKPTALSVECGGPVTISSPVTDFLDNSDWCFSSATQKLDSYKVCMNSDKKLVYEDTTNTIPYIVRIAWNPYDLKTSEFVNFEIQMFDVNFNPLQNVTYDFVWKTGPDSGVIDDRYVADFGKINVLPIKTADPCYIAVSVHIDKIAEKSFKRDPLEVEKFGNMSPVGIQFHHYAMD